VVDHPTLSIVLMAYNEEGSLRQTALELVEKTRELGISAEIVIVDDGSTDGTNAIAMRLASELEEVRVVRHPRNLGLGGVYRTGFAEARGEYVTFFPADGQFPASILGTFVARMGDADLVLGYVEGGRPSLVGRLLSAGERLLYRVFVGPMPRFQGVLLLRRAVLSEVPLVTTGRGWGVLMELVVRVSRGPYRVVSVPTPVRPRLSGASKVQNLRTILANALQIVELGMVLRRTSAKRG